MLLANFNGKEHLRHRAVSLRQHGFLVILYFVYDFNNNNNNNNEPDERVYMLKSNIDQLPDNAKVLESNIIANYAQRSDTLQNVSLAERAAYCDNRTAAEVTSNSDDEFEADDSMESHNSCKTKRRSVTVARIICTFHPSDDEPERKARQNLMLYLPGPKKTPFCVIKDEWFTPEDELS